MNQNQIIVKIEHYDVRQNLFLTLMSGPVQQAGTVLLRCFFSLTKSNAFKSIIIIIIFFFFFGGNSFYKS